MIGPAPQPYTYDNFRAMLNDAGERMGTEIALNMLQNRETRLKDGGMLTEKIGKILHNYAKANSGADQVEAAHCIISVLAHLIGRTAEGIAPASSGTKEFTLFQVIVSLVKEVELKEGRAKIFKDGSMTVTDDGMETKMDSEGKVSWKRL